MPVVDEGPERSLPRWLVVLLALLALSVLLCGIGGAVIWLLMRAGYVGVIQS